MLVKITFYAKYNIGQSLFKRFTKKTSPLCDPVLYHYYSDDEMFEMEFLCANKYYKELDSFFVQSLDNYAKHIENVKIIYDTTFNEVMLRYDENEPIFVEKYIEHKKKRQLIPNKRKTI